MQKEIIDDLKKVISEIKGFDVNSLVRTKELGSQFDFSKGLGEFEGILELFSELEELNFDKIPVTPLNNIISLGKAIKQLYDKIRNFNPSSITNASQVRNQIIQEILDRYNGLFQHASPVVAYASRENEALEDYRKEAEGVIKVIDGSLKQVKEIQKEAEGALNQIKDTAGKVGVAKYAVHFKNEADSHLIQAKKWLWATGISALVTVLYGAGIFWYYLKFAPSLPTQQAIQLGIAKLVIFAVLYFAIVWSGRMYKAQLHNYVVNQHRHNALNTFETFVMATSDDQTKNAVLIQATVSIFSPQHTGFSTLEAEPSASPKVLEIIRSAMGETK